MICKAAENRLTIPARHHRFIANSRYSSLHSDGICFGLHHCQLGSYGMLSPYHGPCCGFRARKEPRLVCLWVLWKTSSLVQPTTQTDSHSPPHSSSSTTYLPQCLHHHHLHAKYITQHSTRRLLLVLPQCSLADATAAVAAHGGALRNLESRWEMVTRSCDFAPRILKAAPFGPLYWLWKFSGNTVIDFQGRPLLKVSPCCSLLSSAVTRFRENWPAHVYTQH